MLIYILVGQRNKGVNKHVFSSFWVAKSFMANIASICSCEDSKRRKKKRRKSPTRHDLKRLIRRGRRDKWSQSPPHPWNISNIEFGDLYSLETNASLHRGCTEVSCHSVETHFATTDNSALYDTNIVKTKTED